jgi:hypothetical protein
MLTTSSARVTALLAAALTLSACGSDKAAGPTTANNAQIISEMKATLEDTASFSDNDLYRYIGLNVAVAGLSAGAPVNQENVTIGEHSYRFNTVSVVSEQRDSASGDIFDRTNIVVGWRHTNGDTLFIAVYAPDEPVATDRRTSLSLMQRSMASSGSKLLDLGRMLGSGQYSVAKSLSAGGPDEAQLVAVYLGDALFGVGPEDEGIVSGSASYAGTSGECDIPDVDFELIVQLDPDSCEPVRSNVALQANTQDVLTEDAGPTVSIPAQSVVGVKFIALVGAVPM